MTQEDSKPIVVMEEKNEKKIGMFYGKCKWFSDKNGYGFITKLSMNNDDKEIKDIFVHFSGIRPFVSSTYKTLLCGEYVNFDVQEGNNGHQAINVTGIYGGPLMCDTNPNIKNIVPKRKIPSLNPNESGRSPGTYTGKCKWFNEKAGYGFIMIESGDKAGCDVFIHYSGISPMFSTYKTLISGEYISFDVIEGNKDIQAVNVKGFDGSTLMCDLNHVSKKTRTKNKNF